MNNVQGPTLAKLIIHQVGNKLREEGVRLSRKGIDLGALGDHRKMLESWFTGPFKEPVYHRFHHVNTIELNEVFSIAREVFSTPASFYKKSKELANLLYEYSTHPRVEMGECYVALLEDCQVQGEYVDALAIFKTETREQFLKVYNEDGNIQLNFDEGISLTRPEKGCLIFNHQESDGYRICILDNQNPNEAQYWKDGFLKLVPVADNYYHTERYLSLARNFVDDRLDDEFEVSRADQIDYLNRSIDYFRKHEQFNEADFVNEVFEHGDVIQSFKTYKRDLQQQDEFGMVSEFDISAAAVKRSARVFKSVLKLDRNFHIYIHGDRSLIERGTDADGRKWYKIYYSEET